MRITVIGMVIPAIFAVAGIGASLAWFSRPAPEDLVLRKEFPAPKIKVFEVKLPGKLTAGEGKAPTEYKGSWPRFRNSTFDGVSRDKTPLLEKWPSGGPKALWSLDVGQGYAGAVIHKGRVYVLDYDEGYTNGLDEDSIDEKRRGDVLRCLSLKDGRDIWRRWYHIPIRRYHGISRTVPAVTDRFVVTIGPKCHVLCCDAITGKAIWSIDLVREYGTTSPQWYAGQCPLIDTIEIEDENGDEAKTRQIAVIAPGGPEVLMLARDCETGEILWKTPNPKHWKMTHSSIIPLERWGTKMYIYCTTGGVVAVSSEDGKVMWEFNKWQITPALSPSPMIIGDERMFFSGGYRAGCLMLKLEEDKNGDPVGVTDFRHGPEVFGSVQQTPILYKKHIYGVLTDNAGEKKQQLVCMNMDTVHLWTSGPEYKFELGPYLIADGKVFALDGRTGRLTMARATPTGWKPLARAKVLGGHEAWAPMAIADGKLILRDLTKMVCLDVQDYAAKRTEKDASGEE